MTTFGLIGEGITDQIIIENVLFGFANVHELDEPAITQLQPPFNSPHGGWTLVFHYLNRGEYRKDLQTLDYLVIQVDTDVSQDVGFDVPWNDSNGPLPIETLVQNVVTKLVDLIGKDTYEAHANRFIFAIAVHSTECWLLPLVFNDNKATKIEHCLKAIDHELMKVRNEKPLSSADGAKDPKTYRNCRASTANQSSFRRAFRRTRAWLSS